MARINIAHGTAKPAGLGPNEPWLDDATGIMYVGDRPVTGSNRNLLVNGDFAVNQRGQGSYTSGYGLDMWRLGGQGGGIVNVQEGGPEITLNAGHGVFLQELEGPQAYRGLEVTASVEVLQCSGGDAHLCINDGVSQTNTSITGPGMYTVTHVVSESATALLVWLENFHAAEAAIIKPKRAKLELGPISTLALDGPADYGAELLRCQRYFFKSGVILLYGWGKSATATYFSDPRPICQRIRPTVIGTAHYMILDGVAKSSLAAGSWDITAYFPGYLTLSGLNVTGLAANKPCFLCCEVTMSAEL